MSARAPTTKANLSHLPSTQACVAAIVRAAASRYIVPNKGHPAVAMPSPSTNEARSRNRHPFLCFSVAELSRDTQMPPRLQPDEILSCDPRSPRHRPAQPDFFPRAPLGSLVRGIWRYPQTPGPYALFKRSRGGTTGSPATDEGAMPERNSTEMPVEANHGAGTGRAADPISSSGDPPTSFITPALTHPTPLRHGASPGRSVTEYAGRRDLGSRDR
jgi:hypothetical protein